jgi:hypothetical protein
MTANLRSDRTPWIPAGSHIPALTPHAFQRAAQRNLSLADIRFVLDYGTPLHRAGAVHVHLRRKDLPGEDRRDQRLQQLVGTTLVLNRDQTCILTLYRNRQDGLRHIKRKPRAGRRCQHALV